MAKSKDQEATTVGAPAMSEMTHISQQMPDYMREMIESGDKTGMDLINRYVVPPRVKVIQKQAQDEKYSSFAPGDLILTPMLTKLVSVDEPFHFIPVFFYPEYLLTNPLELKGQLPMIRERTIDPKSQLAIRARKQDTRFEPCPENPKYNMRYVEVYCFISVLYGLPGLEAMPVAITFSRGEIGIGSQLTGMIQMRATPAPYSNIFEAKVPSTQRRNDKGAWYGINVSNPTPGLAPPFVQDKKLFDVLAEKHKELRKAYDENMLMVEHESDMGDTSAAPEVSPEMEAKF